MNEPTRFDATADTSPGPDASGIADGLPDDGDSAPSEDASSTDGAPDVPYLDVAADAAPLVAAPSLGWQTSGGSNSSGWSVTVSAAGDVTMIGGAVAPIDLGTGPLSTGIGPGGEAGLFWASFDVTGKLRWAKSVVGLAAVGNSSIASDDDGAVVFGVQVNGASVDLGDGAMASGDKTDTLVAKLTSNGAYVFARFVPSSFSGRAQVAARGTSTWVAGALSSPRTLDSVSLVLPSGAAASSYVAKLDAAGTVGWGRVLAGAFPKNAGGTLALAADGTSVVATDQTDRATLHAVRPDGTLAWERDVPGVTNLVAVAIDPGNGDVIASGYDAATGSTADAPALPRATLARFDAAGSLRWFRPLPDVGSLYDTLSADADGDVIVTDSWVPPWSAGGFVAHFQILAIDRAGTLRWRAEYGSKAALFGAAIDAAGGLYVTGGFLGSLDFGGGALVQQSADAGYASDFFLARLAPARGGGAL